ncbi:unnamed protein product [Taenia asiatica]|uniref:WW domain-containing protein n=1 Tax=Taenia asiatica TaxID=60517 RepID=A0A0R3W183_TAEAS|nr:unnamed protein product [Taenia asiatica]
MGLPSDHGMNSILYPLATSVLQSQLGYLPQAGYPPMWNQYGYPNQTSNWYPPQGQTFYPGGETGYSGSPPSYDDYTDDYKNSASSNPYYEVL